MVVSSATFLTDLGWQQKCELNPVIANSFPLRYSFIEANITDVPYHVIMGACLPKVCTQDELSSLTDSLTDKVNGLLESADNALPNGLDSLGSLSSVVKGVVRSNFTRAQLTITV